MIKFHIRQNWNRYGVEIIIADERSDGIYVAKKVDFIFEKINTDGSFQEPTIYLGSPLADQFLYALAESLDEQNIKTDKDAKIQGTLDATRYHLEDLRKILKLTTKETK